MARHYNLVDTSWELTDPNPDIHAMFVEFNREFFWGQLGGVEVKWSKKMTLCAGLCRYQGRLGACTVVLSEPLLKLRARKDLVETLLHEMIHAFLFVADGNREREAHGPNFQSHMRRINQLTGTNITIYHTFHDEVKHYQTHWWKCTGPCQHRPPFFGMVKRSMNRKPGPTDPWFGQHQATCGGTFVKIKEPEDYTKKTQAKESKGSKAKIDPAPGTRKIDEYFKTPGSILGTQPSASYTPTSASAGFGVSQPSTSSGGNSSWKPGFPSPPKPKAVVKKPGLPTSGKMKTPGKKFPKAGQPTLPFWKPKPGPSSNPLPNNSKENSKKPKSGFEGGGGRGGTATAGGSRTVTVITLDDDEPSPRGGLHSSNTSGQNISNSITGGVVRKPAETRAGFVPFSGTGFTLGGGGGRSLSPEKKRPRKD